MKKYFLITSFLLFTLSVKSQQLLTLEQAIETALKNNQGVQAAFYEVEAQRQLNKTAFDLPKTNVSLLYGQYNSYSKKDNNLTLTQSIPITAFGSQRSLNRSLVAAGELRKAATENELVWQVKQVFYEINYLQSRNSLLLQQDSLYEGFLKAAALRYKTGETNLLEHTTAETQRNEIKNQLAKNEADQLVLRTQMKTLLNSTELPVIDNGSKSELVFTNDTDSATTNSNPSVSYMRQQVEVAKGQKKLEAAKAAPEILLGFFSQTLIGVVDTESGSNQIATASDRFTGFQIGLSIPLWIVPHQGRVKSAEYNRQASESSYQYFQKQLQGEYQQAYRNYTKNKNSLSYYTSSALPNAELIIRQSQAAFQNGEISYAEYLLGLQRAITVKEGYLMTLNDYNQSIIYLEFLTGNK